MKHRSISIAALTLALITAACSTPPQEPARVESATNHMKIALTSVFVDSPAKAHEFYTETLGFQSKQFDPAAQLAIVVSADDPNGTALLLEPRGVSFAKDYQEAVYGMGLPIIIFGVNDLAATITELKGKGVVFRDDLAKKAWGIENMFEDTFGNLIMLQEND